MTPSGLELPAELYEEIISYLWNDIPSLKACSLANRMMTFPSQKRLFYCICLRPPLRYVKDDYHRVFKSDLCGTSYQFRQLLLGSPHIADYVISLTIVDRDCHYKLESDPELAVEDPASLTEGDGVDDGSQYVGYKLENGEDVPLDGAFWGKLHRSVHRQWLPEDKFLPLCAPLLRKLQALNVFYDLGWYHLSGRVVITLLNLMQLPSLRYFRAQRSQYSSNDIINQALGEQVKHLVLRFNQYAVLNVIRFPHPSPAPVHLESLSIDAKELKYCFRQNWRIDCGRLRKLVIRAGSDPTAAWSFIQSCSATLEDLDIDPRFEGMSSRSTFDDDDEELVDLSKLPFLKRFAVTFSHQRRTMVPFWWIRKVLQSGYSMSVAQQLETISIQAHYFSRETPDIPDWKPTLVTLLEDEFINLRTSIYRYRLRQNKGF